MEACLLRVIAALAVGVGLGCGGGGGLADPSAADAARLAQLPHVPLAQPSPIFPAELRGFTFHVDAVFDGEPPPPEEAARIAAACVAQCERWVGAAGWTPIADPRVPVDFRIEEHCATHLRMHARRGSLEISRPPTETLAIVVIHNGAPVVIVPRGPADYVCEASGETAVVRQACTARSEHWAQVNILDALIASEPLAQLARQIMAERAR